MESLIGVAIFFGVIFVIIIFSMFSNFIGLVISASASGLTGVTFRKLISMKMRKITPEDIIQPAIIAKQAGFPMSLEALEAHHLANGNVFRVVSALIAAQKAGIDLSFKQATAIDLAGRDVFDAVKMCVKPKVIQTPLVAAMAKNGIQVKAIARVTVKVDINRLIGGASEDTILARVGEGIVTTIGSAETHEEILENPDKISKTIMEKGLDANTAFEILSIDIADVDIGENIGAKLQIDQSEADMKIAQAKAAERRALAEAREQEMKAYEQEMRAKLVEAEAAVPQAISDALKSGNLGILDYYTLKNKIPFHHATILTYKSVYDDLGGYTVSKRTNRAQDYDLWFRFYAAGFNGNSLKEPLYLVREDSGAIRRRTFNVRWNAFKTTRKGFKILNYPKYWIIKPFFTMVFKSLVPFKLVELYRKIQSKR